MFIGIDQIPYYDWLSITVPGAVSAWQSLWQRWGSLPFEQLFEPAIRYATEGYPVSPETALAWKRAQSIFLPLKGAEFQPFKQVFFPNGRAPQAGELWQSAVHAETLKAIAQSNGESFYKGKLAEQIANFAANTGGLLTQTDLANHQPDWVDPICTDYREVTVWEIPPNAQGIATLMALNLLEGFDLNSYARESVESYHLQIEAMKLAFADLHQHIADPDWMALEIPHLLSKNYAINRRQLIGDTAIPVAEPGLPQGGTVYLAAADGDLMVSFIQSNYMGFGSGILVPETAIALHNRATGFTLEPGHPNQVGPGNVHCILSFQPFSHAMGNR